MSRVALLVVVPALALAACAPEPSGACPGEALARFAFEAAVVAPGGSLPAGLDPVDAEGCTTPLTPPPSLAFQGTLSSAASGSWGALCREGRAPLSGTRSGDRWTVEASSDGAVLGTCDPACAARVRVIVIGDVTYAGGLPAAFTGSIVEVLSVDGAACGACVLPCASRYTLTGTVVGGG